MTGEAAVSGSLPRTVESGSGKRPRLYYLDWLRVILILGVFAFHVVHPFDTLLDWHIKNEERSGAVTAFLLLVNPWGMPLFYFVAGAASKFALRRRSNRQYIKERVFRLLVPFIIGSILMSPIQAYFEALHKGWYQGPFLSYIPEWLTKTASASRVSPEFFGEWGFHLWFLAFLFAFSLLALPVFRWLQRDAGQSFTTWLGRLVEVRGGILLFIIPLALSRVLVQPFSPPEAHGWLDFVYFFLFFVLGYVFYTGPRFASAVVRDRWLLFGCGVLALIAWGGFSAAFGDQAFEWALTFVVPWSIILILLFTMMSWGWALFALYLAMQHLNFTNRYLEYGNETIMPFYLLHQPVIIVIAYFVVQWDVGVTLKLLVITASALAMTLGLIELVIKPLRPMRVLFGMKPRSHMQRVADGNTEAAG
jgi:peptidoglycan/LPS O-acetylase OafA/YrhL